MIIHLLVLLIAVTSVRPNPFQKCKQDIIEKIFAHWNITGVPQNILGLSGKMRTYKGTSTVENKQVSCQEYEFVNGRVNVINNGVLETYDVSISDGIISSAGNLNYVVLASDGVLGAYQCSNEGDEMADDGIPDAMISVGDDAVAKTIELAEEMFKDLGFILDKTFSC